MNLKLGLNPPRYDGRALHIGKYLHHGQLPPAPVMMDWTNRVTGPWGMMLNDTEGDCTCAAMGHVVMLTSANAGTIVIPTDTEIQNMYETIGGYVPGDDSTDNGATELDAMKYMRLTGLAGQKVDAFADINIANLEELKQTVALFGAAYLGVWISQRDMDDFQAGRGWNDVSDTNSLGGHAIPAVGYDSSGPTVVTWGQKQACSWDWLRAHMTEAHACLFYDFIKANGFSPSGFDLVTLEKDLKLVTH